jgi:hypothetical protein
MVDKHDPTSFLSILSSAGVHLPEVPAVPYPELKINAAESMYKRIVRYICEFEDQLDNGHEIGGRLISHGSGTTFHIENVGYHGPDLVTFYGLDENGQRLQLIQHINQISILLVAMKKTGKEPRRIGFKLQSDASSAEENTNG